MEVMRPFKNVLSDYIFTFKSDKIIPEGGYLLLYMPLDWKSIITD